MAIMDKSSKSTIVAQVSAELDHAVDQTNRSSAAPQPAGTLARLTMLPFNNLSGVTKNAENSYRKLTKVRFQGRGERARHAAICAPANNHLCYQSSRRKLQAPALLNKGLDVAGILLRSKG
jgi:hypothetical protein